MTEHERLSALGVGPGPSVQISAASVDPEIDGFEERCGLLTDLHLSSLLKMLEEMDAPRTTQTIARISVVRLIPYMSGEETEELLRVLARRAVENRP